MYLVRICLVYAVLGMGLGEKDYTFQTARQVNFGIGFKDNYFEKRASGTSDGHYLLNTYRPLIEDAFLELNGIVKENYQQVD